MAERIVSPGVFTQERDLSFLAQGVSEIAGAFIGPSSKGPAFIPTVVSSQQEYETTFGTPDEKSFLGLTVKNYLRESGQATVVRVLGLDGYSPDDHTPALLYATGSSGSFVYAVIHPTVSGSDITGITSTGPATNFSLVVSSSAVSAVSTTGLSTTTSAASFVGNYLGFGPEANHNGYVYAIFPEAVTAAGANVSMSASTNSNALFLTGSTYGIYNHASTPYIQTQTLGGQKLNLFKVHSLSDGNASNTSVKISIAGPKLGQNEGDYATFTLMVRDFNDTDQRPSVLEQYDGLTLDASSPNFIALRIGNSAPIIDPNTGERYFQGDYANVSNYIWVELAPGISEVSPSAVPFGFDKLSTPIGTETAKVIGPTFISSSWVANGVRGYSVTSSRNSYEFYGFQYSDVPTTNMSYLAPLPSGSIQTGAEFNLENLAANELYDDSGNAVEPANFLTTPSIVGNLRFTVPLQGGFDGDNPARFINMYETITDINTQGFNLATSTSAGSRAYKIALDGISNPDTHDINLLVLPGVVYELHPYVATYALSVCESRGDCFYIMDLAQASQTITGAVNLAAQLDTNYAASYYPWIRVKDTNTNKLVFVPPSVSLPEVYAYNDNVAAEWFAPAGLNRGGIPGAAGVKTRLAQSQRDVLYEGKVNPIAQFPAQGICVWGQKTLQRRASALDRVNVRRLLIAVKKFIASSARFLVFEQNVESTRRSFLNIVNPYLANVQERSGLYAFRVIMDDTNNTPDVIDRNILVGQLYLQPTKTAEFIKLEFNVLPTGAVFPGA
jgi:Phage tail sheath protein subtilisin-like domain/Phage tail sheath C-terminal domain